MKEYRVYYLLFLFFCLSRILIYLSGIRFVDGSLLTFWQFLNVPLLKNDLLRSLYYLHIQPPLLNFVSGIVLKIFPGYFSFITHALFFLLGLLLSFVTYSIAISLSIDRSLALKFTAFSMLTPSCILYENYFLYEYPLMVFLMISLWGICKYAESGQMRFVISFGFMMILICLLRSYFHVIFFVLLFIILCMVHPSFRRKSAVITMSLSVMIVMMFMVKNLLLFQQSSLSSWMGMSLARMTVSELDDSIRNQLVEQGKLSPFSIAGPYKQLAYYRPYLPEMQKTGIPVLDEIKKDDDSPNFNNQAYLYVSKALLDDSLYIIKNYPSVYCRSLFWSFAFYCLPSEKWDNGSFIINREKIRVYNELFDRLVLLQMYNSDKCDFDPDDYSSYIVYILKTRSITLLFGLPFLLIFLLRYVYQNWKNSRNAEKLPALVYIAVIVIYVSIVPQLFEYPENNRFRFVVEPFIFIMAVFCYEEIKKRCKLRISKSLLHDEKALKD